MTKMNNLKLLWGAFAFIFLALFCFHLFLSTQKMPHLSTIKNPNYDGLITDDSAPNYGINQPLIDFVKHFNKQIDSQNQLSGARSIDQSKLN